MSDDIEPVKPPEEKFGLFIKAMRETEAAKKREAALLNAFTPGEIKWLLNSFKEELGRRRKAHPTAIR